MTVHFRPTPTPQYAPANFHLMPDAIILDIQEEIDLFHEEADAAHEYEHCVKDILEEALMYLADEWRADVGLLALGHDLKRCYPADGEVLAPAAMRLGKTLLERLHLYRAYSPDGMLHYRFAKDWPDPRTPVLEKYAEVRTG